VVLLGANVPFAEAAAAARRAQCDAVVLSSSVEPDAAFFSKLARLASEIKRPLFLGGATALAHDKAIHAAGAIALGSAIDAGVERVAVELRRSDARA
jgi:cobalamin-dependent methionine synthase I